MNPQLSNWELVVAIISLPSIVAPWPLLGAIGGFVRFIGYAVAGPLFALHCLLLLAYASLIAVRLVDQRRLKRPVVISIIAILSTGIPALLSLALHSPEWIDANGNGSIPSRSNFFATKGVSFAEWIAPPKICPSIETFNYNQTIYKDTLPPLGPHSLDVSFWNPFTQFDVAFRAEPPRTNLSTYYFPTRDNEPPKGIIIWVHGGGWTLGHPIDNNPFTTCRVEMALDNGWALAAVEYRLGQHGWSGDAQVQDVKDAIRFIHTEYNPDNKLKLIVQGSSAGAHLGLLASYQLNNEEQGSFIDAVVANVPSTSVRIGMGPQSIRKWVGAWSEAGSHNRLCEGVEDCDQKLSPLEQVSNYTPKTILSSSGSDECYRSEHARVLAQRLQEQGIPYMYLERPLQPHMVELVENEITSQIVKRATEDLMKSLADE